MAAWLTLAAEVEPLFGPMVGDPKFQSALGRNIDRGSAYGVFDSKRLGILLGGLLWSAKPPEFEIGWLAVSARHRRLGIGRLLVSHVLSLTPPDSTVVVTTFAAGIPGGDPALRFYERLGFVEDESLDAPATRRRLVYRADLQTNGNGVK